MLPLFECITYFLSVSLEDIKLIAIVNWILQTSDFFEIICDIFKYGWSSLKYSLIDNVLFLSPLIS